MIRRREGISTHRQNSLSEYDNIHVQRFQVRRAVRILVKAPETDKIVVPEQFDFLAGFLHLYVFRCQGVNREDLKLCLSSEIQENV